MTNDRDGLLPLDGAELFLTHAPPVAMERVPDENNFHVGKFKFLLPGGTIVIVKPVDGVVLGDWLVGSEVAAWRTARLLGWTDLVPMTVMRRDAPMREGEGMTTASAQLVIGGFEAGTWYPDFDPHAILRAGVFDFIMGQTDRRSRNWLTVKGAEGRPRFWLHDNGFACLHPSSKHGFSSKFFDEAEGTPLPRDVMHAIENLLNNADASPLKRMLPDGQYEPLLGRAEHLQRVGALVLEPARAARQPG